MGSSVILPPAGQPTEGPDPNFSTPASPGQVSFAFKNLSPPSNLYLQRDDLIDIKVVTNQPAEHVVVMLRILPPVSANPGQPDEKVPVFTDVPVVGNSAIQVAQFDFQNIPLRTAKFQSFPLMEGYLLGVIAFSLVATTRGQTLVQCVIQRSSSGGTMLFSDYVTSTNTVGWPGGRQQQVIEGPGWTHSIQQANPAAGADWTLTALAGQRLRISSFAAVLTASATVANRQVEVIADDGANIIWRTSAVANVTAGQVATFAGTGTSAPVGVIVTDQSIVIPPTLFLEPGWRLRTATTGIQAGDQWSAIWFAVEEWLENS